jgi:hypothetical protein
MLPERDVAAIQAYCEQRNDPETSDQLRVEAQVEPTTVTIVERRAPWSPDFGREWSTVGVAHLRYTATQREWTLQSADSNGRCTGARAATSTFASGPSPRWLVPPTKDLRQSARPQPCTPT